ncbi:hypothetical protein C8R44DRAFT_796938 [Mycena epipterygia]|nr:hypothetical protein C8R44DRAFT_796938 [Mycena epipterygia]
MGMDRTFNKDDILAQRASASGTGGWIHRKSQGGRGALASLLGFFCEPAARKLPPRCVRAYSSA